MVRMRQFSVLLVVLAAGMVGCGEPTTGPGFVGGTGATGPSGAIGNAQTAVSIQAQIRALYDNGNRGMEGALDLFDFVVAAVPGGNRVTIEDAAFRFVDHVLSSKASGNLVDPNGSAPPSLEAALAMLIADLYSFAGIASTPPPAAAFGPDGAAKVLDSAGGLVVTGTQFAGADIPAGTFQNRTLVTLVRLMNPTQPGTGPLPTNLQQFPLFYDIDASATASRQFTAAVCVLDNPPDPLGAPPGIVSQLRLAHPDPQNPSTIQILPVAPSPFLSCIGANGVGTNAPGGLGGLATSFSPFGAVLPQGGPPMATPVDSARILIRALVAQPNAQSDFLDFVDEIEALLVAGDSQGAQDVAVFIIDVMLGRQAAGSLSDPNGAAPPTIAAAVSDLIAQLYMVTGIMMPPPPPGAFDPDGAAKVIDSNGGMVVTSTLHAGVEVPPGAFPNPTLVTIVRLPNPTQAGQGPLPTTLQQFPQFYEVMASAQPAQNGPGVVVGVCVLDAPHPLAPPASVLSQLRLAHPDPANPTTQVDILPLAPVPFLDCSTATSSVPSASVFGSLASAAYDQLGRWTSPTSSFVGAGMLATNTALNPGGLGGLATSFSPFGAVVPQGGPGQPATPADSARILIQALVTQTGGTQLAAQVGVIEAELLAGNTQAAQDEALSIINSVLAFHRQGTLSDPNGPLPPTIDDAVVDLIDQLYTLAGITAPLPPIGALAPDGAASVIGSQGGLVITSTLHAGVDIPAGVFANPTLVTIERLPNPAQNGQGPLPTSLQQFPQFYDIASSAAPGGQVEVGVCVLDPPHPLAPPANVVGQLRLAHPDPQNAQQVEILALAPASFLDCSTATSSLPSNQAFGSLAMKTIDRVGHWTSSAGRFLGVGTLGATGSHVSALNPGGLGGLATSFSPFGAVLPQTGPNCTGPFTGNVTLSTPQDLANLQALGSTQINGDLLLVGSSLTALDGLPCLTDITGAVTIQSNAGLLSIDLPDLQTVGGAMSLFGNNALQTLSLAGLTTTGSVDVSNHANLQSFSAPALTNTAFVGLQAAPLLQALDLSGLQQVGTGAFTQLDALTAIDLPSLTQATTGFTIANNAMLASFSADAMTQMGVGGAPANANGAITVSNHPNLTTLSFASLTQMGGFLFVRLNPLLQDLNAFSGLTSDLHLVQIQDNAGLNDITGLNALGDVASSDPIVTLQFIVTGNVSLCSSDVQATVTILEAKFPGSFAAGGVVESGNLTCPSGNLTQLGPDIFGEAPGDRMGWASTISDDGSRIAVSAPQNSDGGSNAGHVRAFDWNGSAWVQVGQDIDETANLFAGEEGTISLSGDGTRLAFGGWRHNSGTGRVRVFELTGSTWIQVGADITSPGGIIQQFQRGRSVSLSTDGSRVAVGAPLTGPSFGNTPGAAAVYELVGNTWTQLGADINGLSAGDRFGQGISLSGNGNRVAVGASSASGVSSGAGHVRVFDWTGQNWVQVGGAVDGEPGISGFGWFVHLSRDGARVAATAHGFNPGYVKVHELVGNAWVQMGPIFNQANFGYQTVSLSSDGSRFALGDPNDGNTRGSLRVFDWTGASWLQIGADVTGVGSADQFGRSVAISADGTRVVSGAWIRPTPGTSDQRGAASVFTIP